MTAPDDRLTVTVIVRSKAPTPSAAAIEALGARSIASRDYPTREAFAETQGAAPADVAQVEDFAARHGLSVVESDPGKRCVVLSGTAADLERAFGVSVGTTETVTLPGDLAPVVESVLGFDNRPVARPRD